MMRNKIATVAMSAALTLAITSAATAETRWDRNHPRRDQVNDRLHTQMRRIGAERREGDLSRSQAVALRRTDRSIRAQEWADAGQHHGHLTKAEQRQLDGELNGTSRAIGR